MSKILIIDDEKAIRNTLREILEYESIGYSHKWTQDSLFV
jgi:YesN/AraC family two-component response regulator